MKGLALGSEMGKGTYFMIGTFEQSGVAMATQLNGKGFLDREIKLV